MAIGWLAVLQSVPWAEVIANAPKVAEGAKKLWNAVGKTRGPQEVAPDHENALPNSKPSAITELASRVATLESAVSDLHSQMLASSELIKALAEQNTQLVARVELNRLRTLRLAGATAVVTILAAIGIAVTLAKSAA